MILLASLSSEGEAIADFPFNPRHLRRARDVRGVRRYELSVHGLARQNAARGAGAGRSLGSGGCIEGAATVFHRVELGSRPHGGRR